MFFYAGVLTSFFFCVCVRFFLLFALWLFAVPGETISVLFYWIFHGVLVYRKLLTDGGFFCGRLHLDSVGAFT